MKKAGLHEIDSLLIFNPFANFTSLTNLFWKILHLKDFFSPVFLHLATLPTYGLHFLLYAHLTICTIYPPTMVIIGIYCVLKVENKCKSKNYR